MPHGARVFLAVLCIVLAGAVLDGCRTSPRSLPAADASVGPVAIATPAPPVPPPRPRTRSIAIGWSQGCALLDDGSVHCWPWPSGARIVTGFAPVARRVERVENAVEIALDADLACARLESGRVMCWGDTSHGARGAGAAVASAPTEVEGLSDAISIAVGQSTGCAVRRAGDVVCWGDYQPEYQGYIDHPIVREGPADITRIEGTGTTFVAFARNGTAWRWTESSAPRLLDGDAAAHASVSGWSIEDGAVRAPAGGAAPSDLGPASAVVVAHVHVCAIERARGIACWSRHATAPNVRFRLDMADAVALGGLSHSWGCALRESGVISCWDMPYDASVPPVGDVTFADLAPAEPPEPLPAPGRAVQVVAGEHFACARHESGAVRCWGDDGHGQCGDGYGEADGPRWVLGLDDATFVAAHDKHACAVRGDRTVWCWGAGHSGQLGTLPIDSDAPRRVKGVENASALALGSRFSCALIEGGRVRCWGSPPYGTLGRVSTAERVAPADVPGIEDAIAIGAGYAALAIIRRDGTVRTFGRGLGDATGRDFHPPDPHAVVAGGFLAARLAVIAGAGGAWNVGSRFEPIAISSSGRHTWFVRNGRVYCRSNTGTTEVPGIEGAIDVAAGDAHACALLADGTVRCWGRPAHALGERRRGLVGEPIASVEHATRVVAFPDGGCASGERGTTCWGNTGAATIPDGVRVATDDGSCGIDAAGAIRCVAYEDGPEPPSALPKSGATSVTLGSSILRGCAVVEGDAWCWDHGPARRTALRNVIEVALPSDPEYPDQPCAIGRDGRVRCGGTSPRSVRVVEGADGATSIAAGEQHFCVRIADGTVRCWGRWTEEVGESVLGTGTGEQPSGVVAARGINDAVVVRAAPEYTCAVRASGSISCWGHAEPPGVLGDPALTHALSPRTIEGIDGVVDVSLTRRRGCALHGDGRVRCWGARSTSSDAHGDEGHGTARTVPHPAP